MSLSGMVAIPHPLDPSAQAQHAQGLLEAKISSVTPMQCLPPDPIRGQASQGDDDHLRGHEQRHTSDRYPDKYFERMHKMFV